MAGDHIGDVNDMVPAPMTPEELEALRRDAVQADTPIYGPRTPMTLPGATMLRLLAELSRLQSDISDYAEATTEANGRIGRLEAENARLRETASELDGRAAGCRSMIGNAGEVATIWLTGKASAYAHAAEMIRALSTSGDEK